MELGVLLALIVLSAIFSSSETAVFSLPSSLLKQWHNLTGNKFKIANLMQQESKVLLAILLGNTLAGVSISVVGESYFYNLFKIENPNFLEELSIIIILSFILLIFSEITPKTFALKQAKNIAPFYAIFLQIIVFVCKPIFFLFKAFIKEDIKNNALTLTEHRSYLNNPTNKSSFFLKKEIQMMDKIFSLRNFLVKNYMSSRLDITLIKNTYNATQISEIIRKEHKAYFAVIDSTSNDIIGVLNVTKFKLLDLKQRKDWLSLALETPYFIPEQAPLHVIIKLFINRQLKIAIVVDEYGQFEGTISFEDLLSVLFGKFSSEYTVTENKVKFIEDGMLLDASLPISFLEQELNINIKNSRASTVAGFLVEKLDYIPQEKEQLSIDNYTFIASIVEKKRIKQIFLQKS